MERRSLPLNSLTDSTGKVIEALGGEGHPGRGGALFTVRRADQRIGGEQRNQPEKSANSSACQRG